MLVVLLTHLGDRQLTVQLCDHIRFLGGVSKHECLIVSPFGTDMHGIEDVLREAFSNVHTHQYAATMKGWPYGPNEAASEAMLHVFVNPALLYHYLMLEPDCTPTDRRWLDFIDTEYRRSGAAMIGTRIDTVEIATGRVVGKHTIGVAVYPKNFPQHCKLVKSLLGMTKEYHRQGAMPAPWDAYFGPYTARMTADTALIQSLSRVRQVEPDGRVWWDCASLENALSQVRPDAVLIHGSKDLTFLPAINGRITSAPRSEPKPVVSTFEEIAALPNGHVIKTPSGPMGNIVIANGDSHKKLTKEEKLAENQRKRNHTSDMAIRKELEIEAMPGTPEWVRSAFLHTKMPWPKLRAYASQIGAGGFGKGNSKNAIINRVVSIEKEQRKEPWARALPEPPKIAEAALPTPAIPVEQSPRIQPGSLPVSHGVKTTVQWKPVDKNGNPIPDAPEGNGMTEMQKKMLALRQARQGVLASA